MSFSIGIVGAQDLGRDLAVFRCPAPEEARREWRARAVAHALGSSLDEALRAASAAIVAALPASKQP